MKKYIMILAVSISAIAALLSCNKGKDLTHDPYASTPLTVTATFSASSDSKLIYNDDTDRSIKPAWEVDDTVFGFWKDSFDKIEKVSYTVESLNPSGTAKFKLYSGNEPSVEGTYVHLIFNGENTGVDADGIFSFSIKDQTADVYHPIMSASAQLEDGELHFSFKNQCCIFDVEEFQNVGIDGADETVLVYLYGENIYTDGKMQLNTAGTELELKNGTEKSYISLKQYDITSEKKVKNVRAVLLPAAAPSDLHYQILAMGEGNPQGYTIDVHSNVTSYERNTHLYIDSLFVETKVNTSLVEETVGRQAIANCYVLSDKTNFSSIPVLNNVNAFWVDAINKGLAASAPQALKEAMVIKFDDKNTPDEWEVEVIWQDRFNNDDPTGQGRLLEIFGTDGLKQSYKGMNVFIVKPMAPGNVVVGVKKKNSAFPMCYSWSYHIWITDVAVTNNSNNLKYSNGTIVMDRNLGATSLTGEDSYGLYYQWGRKDPFPNPNKGYYVNESGELVLHNTLTVNTAAEPKLYESVISPLVFYTNWDKLYEHTKARPSDVTETEWQFWHNPGDLDSKIPSSTLTFHQPLFDPTPLRFRVPNNGGIFLYMDQPGWPEVMFNKSYDSVKKELSFSYSTANPSLKDYFPVTGHIDNSGTYQNSNTNNYGFYWFSSWDVDNKNVNGMAFIFNGSTTNVVGRAVLNTALTVRPYRYTLADK